MVTEMTKRSRAATAAAISALFSLIVSITTVQKMFIKLEVPKGISIQLDTVSAEESPLISRLTLSISLTDRSLPSTTRFAPRDAACLRQLVLPQFLLVLLPLGVHPLEGLVGVTDRHGGKAHGDDGDDLPSRRGGVASDVGCVCSSCIGI